MATATNKQASAGRPAYDRIHFATMALESGARRLGITPLAMYRRLKQQDLIHQRLLRHYDMLHTQSLDYVVACRRGEDVWQQYDIVEGGVANDNVIDTVEDYSQGIITAEQALGQLRYKPLNHQLCIISQTVIDRCLRFTEAVDLKPEAL